jgi:hypothetical protein
MSLTPPNYKKKEKSSSVSEIPEALITTTHQYMTFTISYMNKGCALSWAEQMVEEIT